MDYQAKVKHDRRGLQLNLRVTTGGPREADMAAAVETAALSVPSIAKAVRAKALRLEKAASGSLVPPDNSALKRRIIDHRKEAPI